MAARLIELCDAIAEYLKQVQIGFPFQVERVNPAFVELELQGPTVIYVYPEMTQKIVEDRESFMRSYVVNVHITNKVNDRKNPHSEIDQSIDLSERIENALENLGFADFEMLQFESEVNGRPPFEIQSLADRNYFHIPISIRYVSIP